MGNSYNSPSTTGGPMKLSPSDIRRFWAKVAIKGPLDCWEWQASCLVSGGYGAFRLYGVTQRAHRIAYFLMKGDLLPDLEILHICNNPKCCNPSHLRQDTHAENLRQIHRDGRMPFRGTNANLKFSQEQILDILTNKCSARALARKYGVDHKTILRYKKDFELCQQESSQPQV